jgi:radical SAM superfamily enzyme YgiQ (UPF0313 family)
MSFGIAVMTPRWLYVLAGATPDWAGEPRVVDEMLDAFDPATIEPGDVVGIGIHTGNALRGYEVGRLARARGAWVVFGGIHATLYPAEAHELGGAHTTVGGDGDLVWPRVVTDCAAGEPARAYQGGKIEAADFVPARWRLLPPGRYMWATVQTVRGCPKHCSFCSVWRTDGQRPRQRTADAVLAELVELRRMGYRFIALADDNFYPVTLEDLRMAARREDKSRLRELEAIRAERFELMAKLAGLPDDMVFYTQITMEASEDPAFLAAMRKAHIRGALVGVESVTPAGLKDVHKGFNATGAALVDRLGAFRRADIHVLGSFIFGLASDRPETFDATLDIAERSNLTFAQFLMLTPLPGTLDFDKWEQSLAGDDTRIAGVPLSRPWLIPYADRPRFYVKHPTMPPDEIGRRTRQLWKRFYGLRAIWRRSRCVLTMKRRLGFVLVSVLYHQRYANSGFATDSARLDRSVRWGRLLAGPCRRLFVGPPMPHLEVPGAP